MSHIIQYLLRQYRCNIYDIYNIYIHIQRIKCFAERHSLLLFHALLISIQEN